MRNLILAVVISPVVFVLLVEATLHFLFFIDSFPDYPFLYTRLEKLNYTPGSQVLREDNVPHRTAGVSTYAQRGIPRQLIRFADDGMRIDSYDRSAKCVIGVFGDSYSDALQVGQFEDFSSLTETDLRAAGLDVDFKNFGMGNLGTTVEYLRYSQLAAQGYRFDHVILQIFPGNDVQNNHKILNRSNDRGKGLPYFKIIDGQLVRDDSYAKFDPDSLPARIREFLAKYSHLANFTHMALYSLKAHARAKVNANALIFPVNSEWEEAWSVTDSVLQKWIGDVRSRRGGFTILMLTTLPQLMDDVESDNNSKLDYPNKRIGSIAVKSQAAYLDMLPTVRQYIKRTGLKYPYLSWQHDGHYNQLGHRLVADSLVPFLQEQLSNCKFDKPPSAS